jgi:hypothetical protein
MSLRLLAELAPPLAAALAAWAFSRIPPGLWAWPSRALRQFARTPRQAILWSAVLSFAVCPIFSWVRPPSPEVHDEFSYLLAADTFAHGRLTNPTPALWQHFESFHINLQPTYQSKYPPGQGLFLAAGQVLTGRPIVGVWLSVAAAAAAVCWMLLAWMPPRWALFGALLPAFHFGTLPMWDDYFWFAYWTTTFWGGAVAMGGGALLFGALVRLLRRPQAGTAATLGLGLIILANTRPYEGFAASLPVAVVLTAWMVLHRRRWKTLATRLVAPAAGVLALGVLAMGYYNYRGTGDPLKMPYVLNSEQYEVAPLFIFQQPRLGKTYNHEVFRDYHYGFMMKGYESKKGRFHIPTLSLVVAASFFWGYALWPPLLCLPGRWTRWTTFAVGVSALTVMANALSSSERMHLHYLAPVAPLLVFLAVAGLRQMHALRIGRRRVGRAVAEATIAVCLLSFTLACVLKAQRGPRPTPVCQYRPILTDQLENSAGKDLVIITYGPHHNMLEEWAYNGADLDGSPIVWARDMGPEENRKLVEYYAERHIWRLYADEKPPRLEPYNDPVGNELQRDSHARE